MSTSNKRNYIDAEVVDAAFAALGAKKRAFVRPGDITTSPSLVPSLPANLPGLGSFDEIRVQVSSQESGLLNLRAAAGDPIHKRCQAEHGEVFWGSSFVLASWLATSKFADSRDVLEVGSGLGLGGLAAAASGASSVVLTDRPGRAMEALRKNVSLNQQLPSLRVVELDWKVANDVLGSFEVIIGSDVLYDFSAVEPLLKVLRLHLRLGGVFACIDPGRDGSAREVLRASVESMLGWQYSERRLEHDVNVACDMVFGLVPLPPCSRERIAVALGLPGDAFILQAGVPLQCLVSADKPYRLIQIRRNH